jgi:hypothetical protein
MFCMFGDEHVLHGLVQASGQHVHCRWCRNTAAWRKCWPRASTALNTPCLTLSPTRRRVACSEVCPPHQPWATLLFRVVPRFIPLTNLGRHFPFVSFQTNVPLANLGRHFPFDRLPSALTESPFASVLFRAPSLPPLPTYSSRRLFPSTVFLLYL